MIHENKAPLMFESLSGIRDGPKSCLSQAQWTWQVPAPLHSKCSTAYSTRKDQDAEVRHWKLWMPLIMENTLCMCKMLSAQWMSIDQQTEIKSIFTCLNCPACRDVGLYTFDMSTRKWHDQNLCPNKAPKLPQHPACRHAKKKKCSQLILCWECKVSSFICLGITVENPDHSVIGAEVRL